MLILKLNTLSAEDLFAVERRLLRWTDVKQQPLESVDLDFNILNHHRADVYGHLLGMAMHLQIHETLGVDESQLLDFFIDVDAAYLDAPYHSFYHAVDIVAVLYYMIIHLKGKEYLSPLHIAIIFISALCHDVGHPGYNNLYLRNTQADIALKYQGESILESLAVEITRQLIERHQLLRNVSCASRFMTSLEDLILATDMAHHYDLQAEARQLSDLLSYTKQTNEEGQEEDEQCCKSATFQDVVPCDRGSVSADAHYQSFSRVLLHAADISNTVRPWPICKQWSDRIVAEFFRQGDAERAAGLPVSPGMDRFCAVRETMSVNFGDVVVKPYFEALTQLLPEADVFLAILTDNRDQWHQLQEGPSIFMPCCHVYERQFPKGLCNPNRHPNGRRVSVAAGTVTIPNYLCQTRPKGEWCRPKSLSTAIFSTDPLLPRLSLFYFNQRRSCDLTTTATTIQVKMD
ncbi:uncharacterized protein BYT42DRAFT_612424 [Radiomyces spectabilis]|uniref:uncharacterized protein n=1 Tax=Radiomyces spectabilis TaxID=64574 RepID=UPI00221FAE6F|nr:uncharacterized protein BYT42DRAFT_612424 [Radiomyces spectabilis]KAI8384745.1 hypothetical protein BYT42DRAFT_612424 [Radiomyces spectabilis]